MAPPVDALPTPPEVDTVDLTPDMATASVPPPLPTLFPDSTLPPPTLPSTLPSHTAHTPLTVRTSVPSPSTPSTLTTDQLHPLLAPVASTMLPLSTHPPRLTTPTTMPSPLPPPFPPPLSTLPNPHQHTTSITATHSTTSMATRSPSTFGNPQQKLSPSHPNGTVPPRSTLPPRSHTNLLPPSQPSLFANSQVQSPSDSLSSPDIPLSPRLISQLLLISLVSLFLTR